MHPFIIAGAGAYRAYGSWHLGVQAGAGLKVPLTPNVSLTTQATLRRERRHAAAAPGGGDSRLRLPDSLRGVRESLPIVSYARSAARSGRGIAQADSGNCTFA